MSGLSQLSPWPSEYDGAAIQAASSSSSFAEEGFSSVNKVAPQIRQQNGPVHKKSTSKNSVYSSTASAAAAKAERILLMDKAVQAIRCIVWEGNLKTVIAWAKQDFIFPVETVELPTKLKSIITTIFQEMKFHREALGFMAKTFQPWEQFLLHSLRNDDPATAIDSHPETLNRQSSDCSSAAVDNRQVSEHCSLASNLQPRTEVPLKSVIGPTGAPKQNIAFNAISLTWMMRTESSLAQAAERIEKLELRALEIEKRFSGVLADVFASNQSSAHGAKQKSLYTRPEIPTPRGNHAMFDELGPVKRQQSDTSLQPGGISSLVLSQIEGLVQDIVQKMRSEIDDELGKHQKIIGTLFDSVQSRHEGLRDSIDIQRASMEKLEKLSEQRGKLSDQQLAKLTHQVATLWNIVREDCPGGEDLSDGGLDKLEHDTLHRVSLHGSVHSARLFSCKSASSWSSSRQNGEAEAEHPTNPSVTRRKSSGVEVAMINTMKDFNTRMEELEQTVPEIREMIQKHFNLESKTTEEWKQLTATKVVAQRAEQAVRSVTERVNNLERELFQKAPADLCGVAARSLTAMPSRGNVSNVGNYASPSSLGQQTIAVKSRNQDFSMPASPGGERRQGAVAGERRQSGGASTRQQRCLKVRPLTAPSLPIPDKQPPQRPSLRPVVTVTSPALARLQTGESSPAPSRLQTGESSSENESSPRTSERMRDWTSLE